ncbi:hypothetical protein [Candidatus Neptunichlamydia sp. REUL1]|uniref:hypothetical protein n=1 Tax=Candidatus Neptunichlamydia sp. REUL1 TaxID=3064277 RepID=UPI002930C13B|nr:hypothetical protein [Candidatus Neptunochlamydia sp. REUL1]
MERAISLLFRLMSASWILMGASGCEKKEKVLDPFVLEEFDFEEERIFSQDL